MATTERLVGSTKAAQMIGRSPRTIHRLVDEGRLVPAVVAPGGRNGAYLFRAVDVEQLARDLRVSA